VTDYAVTITDSVGVTDKLTGVRPYIAPVYCTVQEVCDFLQVDMPDSNSGSFGWLYIEKRIKANEDTIDKETRRAWRPRIQLNETHDYSLYGFTCRHRPIRAVISLSLWQDGWMELTNDRQSGNYWVDYEMAQIYFVGNIWYPWGHMKYRMRKFPQYQKAIKISYIWGSCMEDDTVNGIQADDYALMVKELCIRMTAIGLVVSADYTKIFPTGMNGVPSPEKVAYWQEQNEKDLDQLQALVMF
jgi:hypothetical protein